MVKMRPRLRYLFVLAAKILLLSSSPEALYEEEGRLMIRAIRVKLVKLAKVLEKRKGGTRSEVTPLLD